MRRPHPRFDQKRNAWVTRAGGHLKILARGPKNQKTESLAWDAFYLHMTKLGDPILDSQIPSITLGQLADRFGEWMQREVGANRMKPRTLLYYHHLLQKFLNTVGGRRMAAGLSPHELEMYKTSWHSVQAIQRLYNWGVDMGLLQENPVRRVAKPALGQRQRILSPKETILLFRASDLDFRHFLFAMRHTIARPQEIRALQWKHLITDPAPMFVLTDFKAKKRRRDKTAVRIIPLDQRMVRLLNRLAARKNPLPEDHVFVNRYKLPWTGNAIRCRMRRLRERLGWGPDAQGENIVAYTLRHTSATLASACGVRDKVLAELMGHTSTTTTQRYQHLQADHLTEAIQKLHRRPF